MIMRTIPTKAERSNLIRQIKNQLPAADVVSSAYSIIGLLLPFDIANDRELQQIYATCCTIISKNVSGLPADKATSDQLLSLVNQLQLTNDFQTLYQNTLDYRSAYDEIKKLYHALADADFANFCHKLIDLINDKEMNVCDNLIDHIFDWAIAYEKGENSTTISPQQAEKLLRTVIPSL